MRKRLLSVLIVVSLIFISGCSKVPKVEELNLKHLDAVKLSR